MVKIGDPRNDRSGIIFRMMRAEKASKYIKKKVNKKEVDYCKFNEEKLGLSKIDKDFYEEFKECSEDIKKELIFLWEEVYDLTEKLQYYENKNDNIEIKLDKNLVPEPPPFEIVSNASKRTYIFGP